MYGLCLEYYYGVFIFANGGGGDFTDYDYRLILFFTFWGPCCVACGILVPQLGRQGIKPVPSCSGSMEPYPLGRQGMPKTLKIVF